MSATEFLARPKAGIVTFGMVEWAVNEDATPVVLTLSDSRASIR